ncbi:hypothetical protein GUJ93_ZPchr0004g38776 [Zizania palustris]|uniref:Uncharacterized protein n=1 Tax=Zizania palustris TaxID=103762 RepID=A0A8J5SN22_ZIZPA|nr:hypothetical protein GUJ93_ZPchr0004g38776 [Zizania palustris]
MILASPPPPPRPIPRLSLTIDADVGAARRIKKRTVGEEECSDYLGLSLELGSFLAGIMISTTDFAHHTLEQVTTPLIFKLIPVVMHLGILMRWFPSETTMQNEVWMLGKSGQDNLKNPKEFLSLSRLKVNCDDEKALAVASQGTVAAASRCHGHCGRQWSALDSACVRVLYLFVPSL